MKTVADIMTSDLVSLSATDSIHQARGLLKQHNIRNIPIIDETGKIEGLLTQKDLLNNAFSIVEKYGVGKLSQKEEKIAISVVMNTDPQTMPSTTCLLDAGNYLLKHKHECLLIVDEGQFKGIITSVDFVKLALHLLNKT